MILVHLASSWPGVAKGEADAAAITLGNWAGIADDKLDTYADVVLGIYKNQVVTAFDITDWQRVTEGPDAGRIAFTGRPSQQWEHLIGTSNPGTPWKKGMARPVQYLDTRVLTDGDVDVEPLEEGRDRRAVVGGYALTVHSDGNATISAPLGRHVTVVPGPRSVPDWQLVDADDDAVFRAAFDQVDPEDWRQLRVLLDRIETHDDPLKESVSDQETDSAIEQWSFSVDSPMIDDLRWLLRRSGLIQHFDAGDWQLDDVATATAEDCVRALSRIVRMDHWSKGMFAVCFEKPDSVGRTVLRRAIELADPSN
ncbi:DUF6508 domain-containing protein [Rhodococcus aetherivorans]|uniref:DUF6508 domain-containing protein n=1 Tax=Rhodococcus aetherivorans TaxID=191292 RepID=UPI0029494F2F|nr:DUF6508 domain-containing protein [Rhodococcus aetherivorans]MDV6296552.1 DUF6508 domain-containing protein [Rhodococcus aetherivorans]